MKDRPARGAARTRPRAHRPAAEKEKKIKAYKLTDKDGCTHGGCRWGEGVTHETDGKGELCGPGWLHYYEHPIVAVLLNSIHGCFELDTARLWEAEAEGKIKRDSWLKSGCTRLTTLREIQMPRATLEQRIEFAIRCAMTVYDNAEWRAWAMAWLDGTNRTANAAANAAYAAYAALAAARAAYAACAAANAADAAEIPWREIITKVFRGAPLYRC